jgi:hypothetical protein|tara:strand:- start:1091 stop:1396 length:306 start_codon:yes stop_codon:yes gene_type:complete
MKILKLLSELQFSVYQAMVRIGHSEDVTVQDIGEMLRAMPGVLTVNQVSHNGDNNTAIMKVKLLTTKPASEAYNSFKNTSIQRIPEVKKIEVAEKTIEKKK